MTKQQKLTIEREFYRYKANKEAGGEFIKDYAFARLAVNYESDRVCGSGLNSVESGVINAVDKDLGKSVRAYKWALVFEQTMNRFRWTQKDKLMRLKYLSRWSVQAICTELHISRATYFYWKDEVLLYALHWVFTFNILI